MAEAERLALLALLALLSDQSIQIASPRTRKHPENLSKGNVNGFIGFH